MYKAETGSSLCPVQRKVIGTANGFGKKKEEEEKKNLHFEVKWTQTQIPAAKGLNDREKESKRRCSSPHSSQADALQVVFFPFHSLMSYKFKA